MANIINITDEKYNMALAALNSGIKIKKPTLSVEPVSECAFDFTLPERCPKTRLRQRREVRCST